MKLLSRICLVLVICGVIVFAAACFSETAVFEFVGETETETLSLEEKAAEYNERIIGISLPDGSVVDNTNQMLYLTGNMELMVDIRVLPQLFKCSVDVCPDGTYVFETADCRVAMTPESASYYVNDVLFELPSVIISRSEQVMVRLDVLADVFDCDFVWSESTLKGKISHITVEVELPERYDIRDVYELNEVRDQGDQGTCWAFASLGALESTLLPQERLLFSVDHMNHNNGLARELTDGGDFNIALAYMAAWKGPVLEADDPYGDGYSDETLEPAVHVQGAVNIDRKDYTTIKRMIMSYGGVQSCLYADMEYIDEDSVYYNVQHASYYYPGEEYANHDIVIVGWDDTYPKENFNVQPAADGAFICRNSWGTTFGEGGYFYISYEDTNIGTMNLVYTDVEPADNYDTIYQSDLLGCVGVSGYGYDTAWFANVYTAEGNQTIEATAFYTMGLNNYYEIYVINDFTDPNSFGNMEFVKAGFIEQSGYYTIELPTQIQVEEGKSFAVVVCLRTEGSEQPVGIEFNAGGIMEAVIIDDGQSYISATGEIWESLEELHNCNACLKVFTKDINGD